MLHNHKSHLCPTHGSQLQLDAQFFATPSGTAVSNPTFFHSNMGILSHLTISATGTLAHDPTQLKKWTEANGGKWVPRVQKGVTHLIASKDAWKKRVDAVQQAIDVGACVVSYDWLEDSLQRKRKLAEKKYTWEHLRQEGRKRKELKRMGKILDGTLSRYNCQM